MTFRRKIRAARQRRRREHAPAASVDTHGTSVIARTGGSLVRVRIDPSGLNRRYESVGGDGGPHGTPPRSGIAAVALDANAGHHATGRGARSGERIPALGTKLTAAFTRGLLGKHRGKHRCPQTAPPRGLDGSNGSGRERGEEAGDGPWREADETRANFAEGRGVVVCEWCGHLVCRAVRVGQMDGCPMRRRRSARAKVRRPGL